MTVGVRLLKISALYMTAGLLLGLAMGISGDLSLYSVHSHILLLGWTTMAITGLVYLLVPACGGNRLAALHFWGHNLGLPLMMASLALQTSGVKAAGKILPASSTLVLLSLLIFAVNMWRNGRIDHLKLGSLPRRG